MVTARPARDRIEGARFLVTGGAGFIGSQLVARLVAGDAEVTVVDDGSNGDLEAVARTGARVIEGSILDQSVLHAAARDAEVVVHLAAMTSVARSVEEPLRCYEVNVTGTLGVLEATRDSGARIVLCSSSSVYGESSGRPLAEDNPTRPLSPYGASKLAMEQAAQVYASMYGRRVLVLRLFNVFGPGQLAERSGSVVPRFVAAALRGEPLPIDGDGNQVRDFVPVSRVCDVVERSVTDGISSVQPVNVASGRGTSISEVADHVSAALGVPKTLYRRPSRAGDISCSVGSPDQLDLLFPGLPAVDIRTALEETIRWHTTDPSADHRRFAAS